MGIAENKQLVLDFYAAGARGDMDACFALLAEGVTWTNIGTTVKEYMDTALIDSVFGAA